MVTKYIQAVGLLLVFQFVCYGHDGSSGHQYTCQVPRSCPIAIVVETTCCGGFGCWICNRDIIIVLQTCRNTERCQPCNGGGHKNGGDYALAAAGVDGENAEQVSGHTGGHGGKCAHYGGYYGGGHGKPNGYAQNDGADVENAETAGHGGHHGGHSGGYSTVKCLTEDHYECFVSVPTRTYSTNEGQAISDVDGGNPIEEGGSTNQAGEDAGNTEVAFANGDWSAWNPWFSGNCPVTCCMGNPLQSRTRRCNNPAPAGGGADCAGMHYELRTAPDTERCGSMDSQCAIICKSATSKYADTCSRCVNNYYECEAEGAAPIRKNCPAGQVWSQHMTGCVTPSFCNAVERF